MKFIIDAQLPWQLRSWFVNQGYDAIHTEDLPKKNNTSDIEIIHLATEKNRIVVTKDYDFLNYYLIHQIPPQILMVTTGNIVNKDLIRLFELNFSHIRSLFLSGKTIIEIDQNQILVHEHE